MIELKTGLAKFMHDNLDAENCLEYFLATYTIEEETALREAAASVVAEQFQNVIDSNTFDKLESQFLVDFIKRDDLVVEGEHVILHAVLKWISFSSDEREELFEELSEYIRWEYVKIEALANAMAIDWVHENKSALQLLNDVLLSQCARLQNIELKKSRPSCPKRKYNLTTVSTNASPVKTVTTITIIEPPALFQQQQTPVPVQEPILEQFAPPLEINNQVEEEYKPVHEQQPQFDSSIYETIHDDEYHATHSSEEEF